MLNLEAKYPNLGQACQNSLTYVRVHIQVLCLLCALTALTALLVQFDAPAMRLMFVWQPGITSESDVISTKSFYLEECLQ